jgi:GNAT superfamily N-acetyltransferase
VIDAPFRLHVSLPGGLGYITAVRFDPHHTTDDLFNHYSSDMVVLGKATRAIAPDAPAMLIDRVFVAQPNRGQGYGPAFLSRMLATFKGDCRYAALIPCPFERQATTVEEQLAGRQALARLWESVGFEHFAGEVWVMDLARQAEASDGL